MTNSFQGDLTEERDELQNEFAVAEGKLKDLLKSSEEVNESLQKNLCNVQQSLDEVVLNLDKEKAERVTILLKNAELSQTEECLRQDLKQERDESEELLESLRTLQRSVEVHEKNEKDLILEIEGMSFKIQEKEALEKEFLILTEDLNEKNKVGPNYMVLKIPY